MQELELLRTVFEEADVDGDLVATSVEESFSNAACFSKRISFFQLAAFAETEVARKWDHGQAGVLRDLQHYQCKARLWATIS